MKKKLLSRKGESLAEVLLSMMVIVLGLTLMAQAITAGLRVTESLKELHSTRAVLTSEAENKIFMDVTIKYDSTSSDTYTRAGVQSGSLYYYE